MFINILVNSVQRQRNGFDLRSRLPSNGAGIGDWAAAALRARRQIDNYRDDVFAVGGLVASFLLFGAIMVWIQFGCVAGIGAILICCNIAHLEWRSLRRTAKDTLAELNELAVEKSCGFLEPVFTRVFAYNWDKFGPPECSGADACKNIRDAVVAFGLIMSALGHADGMRLIHFATTVFSESGGWLSRAMNFYSGNIGKVKFGRGYAFWRRNTTDEAPYPWTNMSVESKVSRILAAFSVVSVTCGLIGTWFCVGRHRYASTIRPRVVKPKIVTPKAEHTGLGADPNSNNETVFVPAGVLPVHPEEQAFSVMAEHVKGEVEAKKFAKPANKLLKKGKTKQGGEFWIYEDDQGEKLVQYISDNVGVRRGSGRHMLQYMHQEGDYVEDDKYYEILFEGQHGHYGGDAESSRDDLSGVPAKWRSFVQGIISGSDVTPKEPESHELSSSAKRRIKRQAREARRAEEKMESKVKFTGNDRVGPSESALGHTDYDHGTAKIAVIREKDPQGAWCNAAIIGGKIVIPSHVGDVRGKPSEWEIAYMGKVYPVTELYAAKSDKEFLFMRAPTGLASTSTRRGAPGDIQTGVLVKHITRDSDRTFTSYGPIYKDRHSCSSARGHCGGLVVSLKGDAPTIVGIHGYGDNGSGTNGYHAMTEAFDAELRNFKFPKN